MSFLHVQSYCGTVLCRMDKGRGQAIDIVTLKGDVYRFLSPNSDTIVKLMRNFLDGLRQRSTFAIGLEDFVLQGSTDEKLERYRMHI